ncbi:MAG: hypothetical protein Q8N84_04215 [bacterium]|nr:hypothetical protein [bacterium]
MPSTPRSLFIILGFFIGMAAVIFFIFSRLPAQPKPKETIKKAVPGPVVSAGQKKLGGKVLPLAEPIVEGATHQLVNGQGEKIILLKTNDDKLKFVEGFNVTVVGTVRSTPNGEVMTVEEVGYGVE